MNILGTHWKHVVSIEKLGNMLGTSCDTHLELNENSFKNQNPKIPTHPIHTTLFVHTYSLAPPSEKKKNLQSHIIDLFPKDNHQCNWMYYSEMEEHSMSWESQIRSKCEGICTSHISIMHTRQTHLKVFSWGHKYKIRVQKPTFAVQTTKQN